MMHRQLRNAILVFIAVASFSACSTHIPDHARYIPKDATAVVGLNLKVLSKKIAWNVITGSKMFKEMQDRIPQKNTKDAVNGIDKSGLDFSSTLYMYVKADARFYGGNRVTGIIPMADAGQWETYLKNAFPKIEIKQHGDRKEASLDKGTLMAWTSKVMILFNTMPARPDYYTESGATTSRTGLDDAAIEAEMDNAFSLSKENSIINNSHFSSLEGDGHDLTFWVNYDVLMTKMNGDMAGKMGLNISNTLWKDAALAAGIDFQKGKIAGDMRYYLSSELSSIGTELGAKNADKDMIESLPKENLNMLVAVHLSPKGLKDMLEKMNMLGLMNIALSSQGLSVDNVFGAFTGDMAMEMNNFRVKEETVTETFMGQTITHQSTKPSFNMTYAIKIGNKEYFDKLMKMAASNGLQAIKGGYVIPLSDKDSIYILENEHYVVGSNRYADASGFLAGTFKTQKLQENVAGLIDHPWSMFFDVQQFTKNVDPGVSHSPSDSIMLDQSKKLINNVSFNGGEFKGGAIVYHMDVNFLNTQENSIIELMDYAMKMNEAMNGGKKAEEAKMLP